MEVTDSLIQKLANLAKLKFNVIEKEEIKKDLQKMIQFVQKLDQVDTVGVEPLMHMGDNINIMRQDEEFDTVTREDALKNAPIHDNSFFKVPKVISREK
ncbi:MAG: Asp-tRNA(Asn)/Glu-tRNA(Gln) amidotransferase subunit GatC [Ferruginibacter sp.]